MAQASHGSAPDIAGQGIANPASLILSAGMLLGWLAERGGGNAYAAAAGAIEAAVTGAIAAGGGTRDVGGRAGTADMGKAVAARMAAA